MNRESNTLCLVLGDVFHFVITTLLYTSSVAWSCTHPAKQCCSIQTVKFSHQIWPNNSNDSVMLLFNFFAKIKDRFKLHTFFLFQRTLLPVLHATDSVVIITFWKSWSGVQHSLSWPQDTSVLTLPNPQVFSLRDKQTWKFNITYKVSLNKLLVKI